MDVFGRAGIADTASVVGSVEGHTTPVGVLATGGPRSCRQRFTVLAAPPHNANRVSVGVLGGAAENDTYMPGPPNSDRRLDRSSVFRFGAVGAPL